MCSILGEKLLYLSRRLIYLKGESFVIRVHQRLEVNYI